MILLKNPHTFFQSMPKYVIPEGPSLTGSLPGTGRGGGGVGFGAMGVVAGGHGRRFSHFAPAGGGSSAAAEFAPGGGGGGENNGSGRTTPSSAQAMTTNSTDFGCNLTQFPKTTDPSSNLSMQFC